MKLLSKLSSRKFWLWATALLFFIPLIAVHGMVFIFKMTEGTMDGVTEEKVSTPQGYVLNVYHKLTTNAVATIVFVHGSPGSAEAFREQFASPQPGCNLLGYDRPGYGGKMPSGKKYNLAMQTEALTALLTGQKITNCILVGHSYGGPIVLKMLVDHPELVRAGVLIGGSIDPAEEHTKWIQYIAALPLIRNLIPKELRVCNTEIMALKKDLLQLQKELPTLQRPVMMLHGTKDPLVPFANVHYLETELARAGKSNLFHKMPMEGYNHFIPWQHPQDVKAAIDVMLKLVETNAVMPKN